MAEAATNPAHQHEIDYLDPRSIRPSPFNPRKHLGDLADLTRTIASSGVLQPVTIRRVEVDGQYEPELVFGHRRHAASIAADLPVIPCIMRDLTDDQVLEFQIIENSQREDVHPLDEADGFRVLLDRGLTQADIADRIGRQAAFVAERLKLCDLVEEGRAALESNTLTLGAAKALAKLPEGLQASTLQGMLAMARTEVHQWNGTVNVSEPATSIRGDWAAKYIREQIMARLDDAPWDLSDPGLLHVAGPCTTCPNNTAAQRALFPDASDSDLCTDGDCYRSKLDATWARLRDAAEDTHFDDPNDLPDGRNSWMSLSQQVWVDDGRKTIREFVEGEGLASVTVRDPRTGRWEANVRRADVDSLMARRREEREPSATQNPEVAAAREAARAEQEKAIAAREAAQLRRSVIGDMVRRVAEEDLTSNADGLRDLLVALYLQLEIDNCGPDEVLDIAGLAVSDEPDGQDHDQLATKLFSEWLIDPDLVDDRLRVALHFIIEASRPYLYGGNQADDCLEPLASTCLGIDAKAVTKAVAVEKRRRKKAESDPAP